MRSADERADWNAADARKAFEGSGYPSNQHARGAVLIGSRPKTRSGSFSTNSDAIDRAIASGEMKVVYK